MQFKSSFTALAIMAATFAKASVVPTDGVYTVGEDGKIIVSGPLPQAQTQNITTRGFPVSIEVGCSGEYLRFLHLFANYLSSNRPL